jgi:hypothetical protein
MRLAVACTVNLLDVSTYPVRKLRAVTLSSRSFLDTPGGLLLPLPPGFEAIAYGIGLPQVSL